MGLKVYVQPPAEKDIKALPKQIGIKLTEDISFAFQAVPFSKSSQIKKLKGLKNLYRLRLGNYRVVFRMEKQELFVLRVIHRKDLEKAIKEFL